MAISKFSEEGNQQTNPCTNFLKWNAGKTGVASETEGIFQHFNKKVYEDHKNAGKTPKEAGEQANSNLPLPFKFSFLGQMTTITGWSNHYDCGIFSNEIHDINKGILDVKVAKGAQGGGSATIFKGTYAQIKDELKNAGGVFAKSIYGVTGKGGLFNLRLKGSAVFTWSEFFNKTKKHLDTHFIEVNSVSPKSKGAMKWLVPVFTLGKKMSDTDIKNSVTQVDVMDEYWDYYMNKSQESQESQESQDSSNSQTPHKNDGIIENPDFLEGTPNADVPQEDFRRDKQKSLLNSYGNAPEGIVDGIEDTEDDLPF